MARSNKSTGKSRVRFVMLEAEIEDGDFSQITQAIQNALGPQKVVETHLIRHGDGEADHFDEADAAGLSEDDIAAQDSPKKRRVSSKRTFPTPEVVEVE